MRRSRLNVMANKTLASIGDDAVVDAAKQMSVAADGDENAVRSPLPAPAAARSVSRVRFR